MKKIILILVMFLLWCTTNGIKNWRDIEQGKYKSITSKKWIELFQSKDKDVSIIEVDLEKAWVSFWWLVKKEKFYKKIYAHEIVLLLKNKQEIFAAINWAFFLDVKDKNQTGLSFPIKSQWLKKIDEFKKEVKEEYIDNEIPKRTLVITKEGNAKIFEWYNSKYLENKNYSEVSVAFSPDVKARRDAKIWRSYIWLKCKEDICSNIIFFVADNKTQADMDEIIKNYWVSRDNIIMMDGGPSAQFSYIWEEKTFYWKWKVPQFNIIYEE